jgi:hypothetical protein
LNSPLLLLSFITPPPISGTVSTGIISAFTYTCIHYLLHICPPPFCREKNHKR